MKRAAATLAAAACLALAGPCAAQQRDAPAEGAPAESAPAETAPAAGPSPLTVDVAVGARGVDVTGDATRYRQDVNLDDGLRVLDLALSYVPAERDSTVDRIALDAAGLGGDAYEQLHLEVRKYGAYELDVDRRKSQYFYDDTIVPAALQSLTNATGGDFDTFDFQRVRDSAKLALELTPATEVNLALERQTRDGGGMVPRGLQRDQFHLERTIDETLNAFTAGVEHRWDKVTLLVDERVQTFDNAIELFLPSPSLGDAAGDLATLSLFTLDQSFDYRSHVHTVRALLSPLPRVQLNVVWQGETLDLDTAPTESSAGTTPTGAPFATAVAGLGAVDRDIGQTGIDFGVAVGERVRVVGALRDSALHQSGGQLFGPDAADGRWSIDTTGYEAGVELAPFAKVVISAGASHERRAADYFHDQSGDAVAAAETTRRRGWFARLTYDPSKSLEIGASVEINDIDDPFSLSSPTGSCRYKIKVRQRLSGGWSLSGSYRRTDLDNSGSGWAGDTGAFALRADFHNARLAASLGAGRVDLGRRIDQPVTGGTRVDLFAIDYEANVDSLDASASWRLSRKLTLGGDLHDYRNRGSFPARRADRRGFVSVDLNAKYALRVTYRALRYREDGYDDYDARLVELALLAKW